MPIFGAKPRTWESYMAGIGASGALMASAIVLFVIMVGVVTFKTWPDTGSLLGIGTGGGEVALQDTATPPPGQDASGSQTINLSRLLGPGAAQRQGIRHGGENGLVNGGNGEIPGDSGVIPGGSAPGQPQDAQPPSPPAGSSSNVIGQAVSGVGNTVEGATTNLGKSVNNVTGTGLGDVVSGLGSSLNKNLQSLAGNK